MMHAYTHTANSRYLEVKGTLWITSRYPYFDISDFENFAKNTNRTTKFHKWTCNLTPLVRNICWKYCGKGKKFISQEQFLLFSPIFCYLMLDFYVKTRIRFSLRDKRLFEITEVEITRVDCTYSLLVQLPQKFCFIRLPTCFTLGIRFYHAVASWLC